MILSGSTGQLAAEQLRPALGDAAWEALLDEVRAEVRTSMVDGAVQFPGCDLARACRRGDVRRYRTIVVGLGAMGSAAAAALARRGVDVLGVEQFAPAARSWAPVHGDSRIVRMAYFEHPDYVPLLRRAYDGWAALEQACGRQLITWTGALMIGRPDSRRSWPARWTSVTAWQLPHELLDARGDGRPVRPVPARRRRGRRLRAQRRCRRPGGGGQGAARAGAGGRRRAPLRVAGRRLGRWPRRGDRRGRRARTSSPITSSIAAGPWAAKLLGAGVPADAGAHRDLPLRARWATGRRSRRIASRRSCGS